MCYVKDMPRALLSSVLGLGLLFAFGLLVTLRSLLPVPACNLSADLHLHSQADARDDGYLLPPTGIGYFRHAAYDLLQGRIRFFEMEESPGRMIRYALADKHSPSCLEQRLFDQHLAGLPMLAGRCISVTETPLSASRYLVEVDASVLTEKPKSVAIRDRQTGALLAEYHKPAGILPRLGTFISGASCDTVPPHPKLPLWHLTSFVFADRWNGTLGLTDLERIAAELETAAEPPELLPPTGWIQRKFAEEGLLARGACELPGWMGATEVHALDLDRGPLEIDARLDAESRKAGVVLVDVYAPDKAVILMARAHGPTVWHVHESGRSSVVAVLVRGHHGQAVVGLSAFTRILMSTQLHNPYTNCTEQELRDIEDRVIGQYGISRTQQQHARQDPPIVRYSIGEPMPDGAELFHQHRALSDFELQEN
jgi:hypothetical protein